MTQSKQRQKKISAIEKDKTYSIEEGLRIIKGIASKKFDESVEIHVHLGTDPKKTEQQVKGTVVLPHGTGKTKKIAVFTENHEEAKAAGADIVGGKDYIEKIRTTGKIEFDIAITTPDMMKELAKVAKVLGPRGLMPSPKNDTVTNNIKKTIEEMKKGKITFKSDDTCNLHQLVGKISWDENKLRENIRFFIEAVKRSKPQGIKGDYIKKIVLCTTMSPAVMIKE